MQEKMAVLSLCAMLERPHCNESMFANAMQARKLGFDYAIVALQSGILTFGCCCSKLQIDSSQEKEQSSSGDANAATNDAMKPDTPPPGYDPPGQCVAKMLQTILNLQPVDSGKFLNNEGATLPY